MDTGKYFPRKPMRMLRIKSHQHTQELQNPGLHPAHGPVPDLASLLWAA